MDIYKLFRADKKRVKFSKMTILSVGGFFLYYIFLLNSGIQAGIMLIDQEIKGSIGSWIALITLPIGYFLTKKYYLHSYGDPSKLKSPISYKIFLHYFIYSTGSVILFILLIFILLLVKKSQLNNILR
jgi:hypothetical protein